MHTGLQMCGHFIIQLIKLFPFLLGGLVSIFILQQPPWLVDLLVILHPMLCCHRFLTTLFLFIFLLNSYFYNFVIFSLITQFVYLGLWDWQITPMMSLFLVVLSIFPCTVQIWRRPQQQHITQWVAYAYTCGFMFGWHVHEKASLHFVIPLSLVAIVSSEDAGHYIILSIGLLLYLIL